MKHDLQLKGAVNEEQRKILVLFNKKALELENSRFSEGILAGSSVALQFRANEIIKSERIGPDYESIKAFYITLRNFMLAPDPISIRKISKIYQTLYANDPIRIQFDKERKRFNTGFSNRPNSANRVKNQ